MDDADEVLDSVMVRRVVIGLLVLVSAGGAADLWFDRPASWWTLHVLLEVVLMAATGVTALFLARGWHRSAASLTTARRTLAAFFLGSLR